MTTASSSQDASAECWTGMLERPSGVLGGVGLTLCAGDAAPDELGLCAGDAARAEANQELQAALQRLRARSSKRRSASEPATPERRPQPDAPASPLDTAEPPPLSLEAERPGRRSRLAVHFLGVPDDLVRAARLLRDLRESHGVVLCGGPEAASVGALVDACAGQACASRVALFVASLSSIADIPAVETAARAAADGRVVCAAFVDHPSSVLAHVNAQLLDGPLRAFLWTWSLRAADAAGFEGRVAAFAEALRAGAEAEPRPARPPPRPEVEVSVFAADAARRAVRARDASSPSPSPTSSPRPQPYAALPPVAGIGGAPAPARSPPPAPAAPQPLPPPAPRTSPSMAEAVPPSVGLLFPVAESDEELRWSSDGQRTGRSAPQTARSAASMCEIASPRKKEDEDEYDPPPSARGFDYIGSGQEHLAMASSRSSSAAAPPSEDEREPEPPPGGEERAPPPAPPAPPCPQPPASPASPPHAGQPWSPPPAAPPARPSPPPRSAASAPDPAPPAAAAPERPPPAPVASPLRVSFGPKEEEDDESAARRFRAAAEARLGRASSSSSAQPSALPDSDGEDSVLSSGGGPPETDEEEGEIVPADPLRLILARYARHELAREEIAAGLALYVPVAGVERSRGERVDVHTEIEAFLRSLAPSWPRPAKRRALLLLGEAGASKSTTIRAVHRGACEQWLAGDEAPDAPLPVTVLLALPELLDAAGGRRELRAAAAARLGVDPASLPELRARCGLAVLLDGYDEAGESCNVWERERMHEWAGGAVFTCRVEHYACLRGRPEDHFAPSLGGAPEPRRLRQLTTLPFTPTQVHKYLRKYAAQHAADPDSWPYDRYASELRRTPNLGALAANPLLLRMAARVLPALARRAAASADPEHGAGRRRPAVGLRALYRTFVDEWLAREARRAAHGKQLEEAALLDAASHLCRRLAALLFRMRASQVVLHRLPRSKSAPRADLRQGSAEQRACELLLSERELRVARACCPLRWWRRGDSVGFAFAHRTLGEFLAAEALLASLEPEAEGAEEEWPGAQEEMLRPLCPVDFSTRSIAGEATLVSFLAEAVHGSEQAAESLLWLVKASRGAGGGPESPPVVAAANAATVLAAGRVSLAGRDLRSVRLPGANLRQLEAAGSDLRGADLRGCSLQRAWLAGADLRGARLEGCRVDARPAVEHGGGEALSLAWLPDGRRLVTCDSGAAVRVWDAVSGAEILQLRGQQSEALAVAVSPGGSWVVAGCRDGAVRVWYSDTGVPALRLLGHTAEVHAVAVSPDGRRVASGGADRTARVWDADLQAEVAVLEHAAAVNAVAFLPSSPDRVVTAGDDWTVRVWRLPLGEELMQLRGHANVVTSIAVSPDGRRIASASWDRSARLWDAETGAELLQLWGHPSAVNAVAYSPDGRRLASGGWDASVRLWDAETGTEFAQHTGHADEVTAVAFAPDGRTVASASRDTTARVWNAEQRAADPRGRASLDLLGCQIDATTAMEPRLRRLFLQLGAVDSSAPARADAGPPLRRSEGPGAGVPTMTIEL